MFRCYKKKLSLDILNNFYAKSRKYVSLGVVCACVLTLIRAHIHTFIQHILRSL